MELLDSHRARLAQIRAAFVESNGRLVARLRAADDELARRRPTGDRWSAAEIGWHVAMVSNWFAGVISGDVPEATPVAADFVERPWFEIGATISERLRAPAAVQPPPGVTRAQAIAALEVSGTAMERALDAITAERAGGHGISSSIVGRINLYQVGEWATAHVARHNKQAKQALA